MTRSSDKKYLTNLLKKNQINSEELVVLLEGKKSGLVDFTLIDVREITEWRDVRILGTNKVLPSTSFKESLDSINNLKNKYIILYCFSGIRSRKCQKVMTQAGFNYVINLSNGIISFTGSTETGN